MNEYTFYLMLFFLLEEDRKIVRKRLAKYKDRVQGSYVYDALMRVLEASDVHEEMHDILDEAVAIMKIKAEADNGEHIGVLVLKSGVYHPVDIAYETPEDYEWAVANERAQQKDIVNQLHELIELPTGVITCKMVLFKSQGFSEVARLWEKPVPRSLIALGKKLTETDRKAREELKNSVQ